MHNTHGDDVLVVVRIILAIETATDLIQYYLHLWNTLLMFMVCLYV